MSARHRFVAVAPRGVEPLLEAELTRLGAADVQVGAGAVTFEGDLETGYRVLLGARTASRLLLPLEHFTGATLEALDAAVARVPWHEHLSVDGTLAVSVAARATVTAHTRYVAQRTKDVICDGFRARTGRRPSVDPERPDLRIHVHLTEAGGSVAIDLAGDALHRRGYRGQAAAPLKETLAAALLLHAGVPEALRAGRPFVDPMCGSGTFLCEAFLAAHDVPPGVLVRAHPVARWLGHDARVFARVRAEGDARLAAARDAAPLPLYGGDLSPEALESARLALSWLGARATLVHASLEHASPPPGEPGVVVVNPPYGERLGTERELVLLYETLGDVLRRRFMGYDAYVLTSSRLLEGHVGLRATSRLPVWNGALECRFSHFPIAATAPTEATARHRAVSADAAPFENRLRKNLKVLGKRAAREGLEVVRLYDRDIPEFNLAVDRYRDHVIVQEFAPPDSIDPKLAARRLRDAFLLCEQVLGVPRTHLHLRVRKRQTAGGQYDARDADVEPFEVHERGARFEVRLGDHLDTGYFGDLRLLRDRAAEAAKGGTLLNLYAYTATASVRAGVAGARETTSVDLSATYADWARENLARNGLRAPAHRVVEADCGAFLRSDRRTYDVIYLNPPSYSRAHRVDGDFSVVRDHAELLRATMARLAPGGQLFFATHARGFVLDEAVRERHAVEDISEAITPFDHPRARLRAYVLRAAR